MALSRKTRRRCWAQDEAFYIKMLGNHKALWKFLEGFAGAMGIVRILEVGGGLGLVSEWCKGKKGRYTNVDRNPKITDIAKGRYARNKKVEFVVDDFCCIDTRKFQDGHFGMVLAAGVIEHCPSYQEFIHRCMDVDSTYVVITFFRSLLHDSDRICRMICPQGIYYENHYAAGPMMEWLETEGIEYQFHTIKKKVSDVILIIDTHGGRGDGIREAVESLGMTDEGWGEWAVPKLRAKLARKEAAAKKRADARASKKKR